MLGFEGIDTDGQYIRPRSDAIADHSSISGAWDERVRESIAESRRVLEQWLGHVQFVDLTVQAPEAAPTRQGR